MPLLSNRLRGDRSPGELCGYNYKHKCLIGADQTNFSGVSFSAPESNHREPTPGFRVSCEFRVSSSSLCYSLLLY